MNNINNGNTFFIEDEPEFEDALCAFSQEVHAVVMLRDVVNCMPEHRQIETVRRLATVAFGSVSFDAAHSVLAACAYRNAEDSDALSFYRRAIHEAVLIGALEL